MKKAAIRIPVTLAVLALFVPALLAGCAGMTTVPPKENITGTYELEKFNIATTGPGQSAQPSPAPPGAPGDTAATFYANLKLGATTTEKDVASYSGNLKVARDSWNQQVIINGVGHSETGTYTMSFTGSDQAVMTFVTPEGRSTRKIAFTGGRSMTVDYPIMRFPDGSTIHEVYTWKKVSDKV